MPTSGDKSIEQLHNLVVSLAKFKTSAYVEIKGELREINLTCDKQGRFIHIYILKSPGNYSYDHHRADTVADAFAKMSELKGTVYLTSVQVAQEDKDLPPDSEIYRLTLQSWATAFTIVPFGDEAASANPNTSRYEIRAAYAKQLKDKLWANLIGGPDGIARWNAIAKTALQMVDWSDSKLSGLHLAGAVFPCLNFGTSNFDRAKLQKASLNNSYISGSSCRAANMDGADLANLKATGVDFTDASLIGAMMQSADLRDCVFAGTNLTGANLKNADLKGADLNTAILTDAQFNGADYDERTTLPQVFPKWSELCWRGKGVDPYKAHMKQRYAETKVNDFDEFMTHLQARCESSRLHNVFKMLKTEHFQLFSEVTNESVIGVVKSQTNPDLVYACRLAADGSFCCCTQNLKPCGGLHGALCKHLLVLVIGLAKAKQMDLTKSVRWILASTLETPALNKPVLTEVFLKYQGVAAGEVDWRPTETMPEDYYAY